MQIEIQELKLKYRELRICDRGRQSQLAASLLEHGQQVPILVVPATGEEGHVLIDGYARVAALESLGRDVAEALVLALDEPAALVWAHRLAATRRHTVLEEAWLVRELVEGHGKSQVELSVALHRSVSWVSRRLALVRVLPGSAQAAVKRGALSAQAAMKFLVPLARAKHADCEKLVTQLGQGPISVRQMQRLYEGWKQGDAEQRARVVAHPHLYLKAQDEIAQLESPEPDGGCGESERLACDLEGLSALCRRVRRQVRSGVVGRAGSAQRAAMITTWHELRLIFDSLVMLIEKEQEKRQEEGIDA